jgi:hypothetical protein
MEPSSHCLTPFLPLFCSCQFRRLDWIQLLRSQVRILAARRLEILLYSTHILYCRTFYYNHFARTTQKIDFVVKEVCLLIRCLLLRAGFRGNVFTESLPSNRYTRHNILCPSRPFNQAPQRYISSFNASVALLGARHFVKGSYHCCGITLLGHCIALIEVGKRKCAFHAAQCRWKSIEPRFHPKWKAAHTSCPTASLAIANCLPQERTF